MFRILFSIALGGIAGYAWALFGPGDGDVARDWQPQRLPAAVTLTACVADTDLEAALLLERDATQRLLHEIDRLESEIEALTAREAGPGPLGGQAWLEQAWQELAVDEQEVDRQQQLVDGGFDLGRADWLARRESELRQAVIEERVGAMPLDPLQIRVQARQALRNEIGDYEYEQYLAATGQSTAVAVTQVMPDSAASIGGLQVGDEIIDYAGTRVFNVLELGDVSNAGTPGDAVIVTIERDGTPMQLVLPRGTLGISAGKPRR